MTPSLTDNYRFLSRYNGWINGQLYAACERLTDEERKRDRGAFFGSIHGTLNHLAVTDQVWLRRLARSGVDHGMPFAALPDTLFDIPEAYRLDMVLYDDWAGLRARRLQLDAAIEHWTADMPEAFPSCTMRYSNSKGVERRHPAWQAITHLFNHQTHHRSQAITLLTQAGVDVGVTDMLAIMSAA
ncbi:MAG: damage-inducible protein DinB [Polaromonas sp.]|nr:damage-inducible protein DinB [Polaromonas sp.]